MAGKQKTFAGILKADQGCTTPAEAFIISLVLEYSYPDRFTPGDPEREVAEFNQNSESMVDQVKHFAQHIPSRQ